MRIFQLLLFVLTALCLISCNSNPYPRYQYQAPQQTDDGLMTGELLEPDINIQLLEKMVDDIRSGKFDEIHSVLIFNQDKLVFEEYFEGHVYKYDERGHHGDKIQWDKDTVHHAQSATKSVVTALTGIAIDQGFIKSENDSIFDYLPRHKHLATEGKEKITIAHLATMTSGLDWPEWSTPYANKKNPMIDIWYSELDPVSHVLSKPLKHQPGTTYNYNTGNMTLLGEVIRNSSNQVVEKFSRINLFEPLGVNDFRWFLRYRNDVLEANSLKLTPRAMIKFGALFLNNGKWKGKQVVSEDWVSKSRSVYKNNLNINIPGIAGKRHYGYGWWIFPNTQGYAASGWGGQEIIISPELQSVIVFTGGNYSSNSGPMEILRSYILPAYK